MSDIIDEGFQYKVYDLGDKVRKVPKTREEMVEYSKSWGSSEEKARKDTEKGIERRKEIQQRLRDSTYRILADFEFVGEVIVQEKVKVTKEVLDEAEKIEEKKEVIQSYINLVKQRWRNGFHDMSYNFTVNTGFDSENRMVHIDLGDLIFDFDRVRKEVEDRKWVEESWSYQKHLEGELADYYISRMKEAITVEKLDEIWNKSSQ
ncbi:MAG: hypothetical protein ABEJ56_07080 [Candidatus Nanohaloarchaea archaeon]